MIGGVGRGFDRVARIYAPVERLTFGPTLRRCRERFLSDLEGARRALVLGDGDGRFTAALLARYPDLEVTAVDGSATMLAMLATNVRRRAPNARLTCIQEDLRVYVPRTGDHDLVVTHFFLDCLTTEEAFALGTRLAPYVTPDARWVLSEFAVPAGAARWPGWLLVRLLYLAFRVLTGLRVTRLPDYEGALARVGFTRVARDARLFGIVRGELWQRG